MGQSYTHAHTHTYIQRVGGGGREGRPTTTIATDDGQRALLSLLSIVGESRDQKEKRHPRRTDQYEINTRIDVDSRRQERQEIENRRDKERKKERSSSPRDTQGRRGGCRQQGSKTDGHPAHHRCELMSASPLRCQRSEEEEEERFEKETRRDQRMIAYGDGGDEGAGGNQ